ncbi:MAG: hypothetical protein ACI85O_002995 [Saprospiraceae bacterium]|jgi:hypothetical protein
MKLVFTTLLLTFTTLIFAQNYQNAESVEYDPSQNRWLVANGDNILQRAADGTLSAFGTGPGSHGMEVVGENVFVCEGGNRIRGYNLETEEEVMNLPMPSASFLNGLTNDGGNFLYATDFSDQKIYKIDITDLSNPTQEVIVANTVVTPNGLLYDGENNRLLWVTWGNNASIRAVDLTDNSLSIVQTTSLSNIDGIDEDNDQNYYISSWGPARITKFDKDFINAPETVTTPGLTAPADIGYSKQTDTLAIPMGGNVIYVGLGEPPVVSGLNDLVFGDFGMNIFPNPVTESSVIQFELETSQKVDLTIFDMEGRKIRTLLSGTQMHGKHKVVLAEIPLSNGVYFCRLMTEEGEENLRFVVGK